MGNKIVFVIMLFSLWLSGFLIGNVYRDTTIKRASYILDKQVWDCFIAFIPNDPTKEKRCVVYREKDLDLRAYPSHRRGSNDVPEGQPILSTQ